MPQVLTGQVRKAPASKASARETNRYPRSVNHIDRCTGAWIAAQRGFELLPLRAGDPVKVIDKRFIPVPTGNTLIVCACFKRTIFL